MKKFARLTTLWPLTLLATSSWRPAYAQAGESNRPPEVSILWPQRGDAFSVSTLIKIKATASDPDGSIAEVRFFAGTNLVGVVTNPPYNAIWEVNVHGSLIGTWNLKAVAVDNHGVAGESIPVTVFYYAGGPPRPVLQINSPINWAVFSSPATFDFSAELLASTGDTGPVEFFVGTNSVALIDPGAAFSATTPPISTTVSNLLEGEHTLTLRYRGLDGTICTCALITNTVRVVKLGVQLPSVTPDGRLQFEVVTSFPGKETIIQSSENLLDWLSISTNQPSSNTFTFTEPSPATNFQRFYRVLVPP